MPGYNTALQARPGLRAARAQPRLRQAPPRASRCALNPGCSVCGLASLLRFETRGLHDGAPFRVIGRNNPREFLGRSGRRIEAELGELLDDIRCLQRLVDAAVEQIDD